MLLLLAWDLTFHTEGRFITRHVRAVSLLGWLPTDLLLQPGLFWAARILFYVSSLLWAARWALPWSAWLTVGGFTATVSIYQETNIYVDHVHQLTNLLLLINAAWYQFYAREIRAASREHAFWRTQLCPEWVPSLYLAQVGAFYTLAGLGKLVVGGLGWANGTSLQLWVSIWGNPQSPFTSLILQSRLAAQALQLMTVGAELLACLAWPFPRLRPWLGLLLLTFHLGNESVFGFRFYANTVIVALVLLPVRSWVERLRSGLVVSAQK